MSTNDAISTIRNLGPAMEDAFVRVGITSADQLREIGADAAYMRLLNGGSRPHFIAYYALVMGLQGRPWNDAKGKEKDALRVRFDALKFNITPGETALDKALADIGVIEKQSRP